MENDVITLAPWQVALAYLFVVVILFILRRRSIRREKILLLATVRMTIQLIVMGYVLTLIIDNPHPLLTMLVIVLMLAFAVFTVLRRFKGRMSPSLKRVVLITLPGGSLVALLYFLFVVIRIEPFYNPQYFIPISGMVIGNSMTGITLGVNTMINRFTDQKAAVMEALHLGATPRDASHGIINEAFDQAIMPTLNNMLGMGVIFLPGMMTGQILSGVSPSLAILYQIGVMLAILGGVSFSTYLFLRVGYRTFFNRQAQLIGMD